MNDSDIVQDFLAESSENLDRLDRELVGLEKHPHDRDALASVFRTIHTIKGTCGFLGFNKLEKVTHVGESLLARFRDGQLTLSPEHTTALLGMVDAVRQMLKEIQSTGQDGEAEYPEVLETLVRLLPGGAASKPEGTSDAAARSAGQSPAPAPAPGIEIAPASSENIVVSPALVSATASKKPARKKAPKAAKVAPAEATLAAATLAEATIGAPPAETGPVQAQEKVVARQDDVLAAQQTPETRPHDSGAETIRVGVNVLDKLMTLVGELVLARNQLLQIANSVEDTNLQAVSQRMNLIATELQEEVMKTRLQPIGNIWSQFPRTVRDVALGCGKEVNIEMEGKETELDKTIIEAIKDPLTHLVRNSVDHGIELPADRVKAGKDRAGRLILRAFHEGGQVNIEITDDGAGLNVERIRQKAVERGMVTAEHAARMTEREIFKMIFLPGFSTAEKVTKVSGRGVGMDVVKTNVERIGGSVDVQSAAGRGTTVRVKIPLTLGHHPGVGGNQRRRSLRHSPGQLARTGADRGGRGEQKHRIGPRRAGLPAARTAPPSGLPEPGTKACRGCEFRDGEQRCRQHRGAASR